ncbi:hypothetical protein CO165_01150 [Candidatus Roizmanbacteria bacterium CG_4_9_14_3_um_filter_33_18]|uniref:Transcobalamin-like C-terminal domain-containing protein n=1 Tax=Candidatus Roizmanbacteria bacterium CG_4_9_14_3_um_filter_33_18 TaxID=1974841 RepID=A0A2M7XYU6_9BACT|nr:MAG: hypothetical protein CO165_01150 [Candidatus Roizmanbacteria bacterium CG_4_9_14_3_um_filter_33_18]
MFKKNIFKIIAVVFLLILSAIFYTKPIQLTKLSNTPSPTVVPTKTEQNVKVSLSINDLPAGQVDMKSNQNHCDVLSEALSQKKIKSLDMRYNKDFKTSVVYQINGIGKKDSVWWGFKVNSKSPDQGCSYINVKNGDSSDWSYLGN